MKKDLAEADPGIWKGGRGKFELGYNLLWTINHRPRCADRVLKLRRNWSFSLGRERAERERESLPVLYIKHKGAINTNNYNFANCTFNVSISWKWPWEMPCMYCIGSYLLVKAHRSQIACDHEVAVHPAYTLGSAGRLLLKRDQWLINISLMARETAAAGGGIRNVLIGTHLLITSSLWGLIKAAAGQVRSTKGFDWKYTCGNIPK